MPENRGHIYLQSLTSAFLLNPPRLAARSIRRQRSVSKLSCRVAISSCDNTLYQDGHTDKNQKKHYENVRASFEALNDLSGWSDEEETSDEDANIKEDRQHENAQFFDLEAAMYLEQWDDVARICQSNDRFPKPWFYPPIMDLTLKLDLPPALAVKIIKVPSSF
jgi:hypothetical protein